MQSPKPTKNGQVTVIPCVQALDDIAAFIRRHLVCDEHQLTLLTLWSACTQCHHLFSTAPYLWIHSPQPQSGKSLCLNLLCDLLNAEAPFTGVPGVSLLDRLLQGRALDELDELHARTKSAAAPCIVFIDDCQHSFGPSERQPVVCLLASGSAATGFFPWGDQDYSVFGPKALAGNSVLPRSLAARCIPIRLCRPKASEKFARYRLDDAAATLDALRSRLRRWLQQASPALVQAAKNLPPDLPAALAPGQSKCAEPLVHIADAAGGTWPAKVRAALVAVFNLADANPELQILFDLRVIFGEKNNPEYLATADLLSELHKLDSRPWNAWTSKSGRRLAAHLRPFGIVSQRVKLDQEQDFMAYLRKDFEDSWERYLPPSSVPTEPEPIQLSPNGTPAREESMMYAMAAN